MKPAPVDYVAPRTVADAVAALADGGEGAKVLAGGQSLLPTMAMRLARPSLLVDVARIPELRRLALDGPAHPGAVRVGAGVRHVELERGGHVPGALGALLRTAAGHIGHLPIRTRGTFGGSLAHADPAAEWPLVALAADATVHATGPAGDRAIPAGAFFETVFTTALAPDEVLVAVDLPVPAPTARSGFAEVSRRAGDFALVACAVLVDVAGDVGGSVRRARVALGGVADRPVRCAAAEDVLVGRPLGAGVVEAAGAAAAAAVESRGDLHAGPDLRRSMVAAVVRRALLAARDTPVGTAGRVGVSP